VTPLINRQIRTANSAGRYLDEDLPRFKGRLRHCGYGDARRVAEQASLHGYRILDSARDVDDVRYVGVSSIAGEPLLVTDRFTVLSRDS
jgi:hypothetical protein